MDGDRRAPSAAAASVAAVLGGGNLLREILLRLGFPHYLVRAALVSKQWLLHASDPAILRRFFGDRDPPRLLGFCVSHPHGTCEFVALPQPPELAALSRRAASSCNDAFLAARRGRGQWIRDCRNGRLLIQCADHGRFEHSLLTPLLSGKHVAVPPTALPFFRMFLTEDGRRDGVTMVRFYDEGYPGRQVRAEVNVLGSAGWGVTISTPVIEIQPRYPAPHFQRVLPPVHGKIFMVTNLGYTLVLDLKTQRFFILDLPDGVECNGSRSNFLLSCAENSGIYLVNAQQFQISVWLHRMTGNDDGDGAGCWLLVDTFCIREACARLDRWVRQNGGFVEVLAVGDNADFVFLEHGATGAVFYVHLRSKVVQKVYQRVLDADGHVPLHGIHIFPIMMSWPPIFPTSSANKTLKVRQVK